VALVPRHGASRQQQAQEERRPESHGEGE